MIEYSLGSPAKAPGVYALQHRSGITYLGKSVDLRRRWQEYRTIFSTGLKVSNARLQEALSRTSLDDWRFVVILVVPDAASLGEVERRAITKARRRVGEKLLNTVLPEGRSSPAILAAGLANKSTILADDGSVLGVSQAAKILGCRTDTLQKRLANMRSRGVFEVHMRALVGGLKR